MLSAEKRHCGIVFQNYALFPNLNVEENIAFGLDKKKWDKAQRSQRVQQLLELIELPDIAKISKSIVRRAAATCCACSSNCTES